MRGLVTCTRYSYCFANKDGKCICLSESGLKKNKCSFYKTRAQVTSERLKNIDILKSRGRDDLIEKYHPETLL